VTVNAMVQWYQVGPSAHLFKPEVSEQADAHLRRLVDTIHKAGAKSIIYLGPVQVPWLSKEFVAAHPDWLRIRSDGKPDPSPCFANIRSGYGDCCASSWSTWLARTRRTASVRRLCARASAHL